MTEKHFIIQRFFNIWIGSIGTSVNLIYDLFMGEVIISLMNKHNNDEVVLCTVDGQYLNEIQMEISQP